jgi:hypothetical protein
LDFAQPNPAVQPAPTASHFFARPAGSARGLSAGPGVPDTRRSHRHVAQCHGLWQAVLSEYGVKKKQEEGGSSYIRGGQLMGEI